MAKIKCNITLTAAAKERLLQYGEENHLSGGLSGAIEHAAWAIKVSKTQLRGQESFDSIGLKRGEDK